MPRLGRGVGHAVSTVSLSALILLFGWMTLPWIGPRTLQEAWIVGALWTGLTLVFEFLGGHFIFGKPWAELLADYNLLAGRIWSMVPHRDAHDANHRLHDPAAVTSAR